VIAKTSANNVASFEAAWQGDIETVKALTLHERIDTVKDDEDEEDKKENNDSDKEEEMKDADEKETKDVDETETKKEEAEPEKKLPPLLITTKDPWDLNVFAIALVKKNYELAQVILDIAAAQYAPEGPKKAKKWRFRISGADEVDSDCEYEADEVPLTSELVDDDFTIEDLGALNAAAGSTVSPADMLLDSYPLWVVQHPLDKSAGDIHRQDDEEWKPWFRWSNYYGLQAAFRDVVSRFWVDDYLLSHAVHNNDMNLVKFLMRAVKGAKVLSFDEGHGALSNNDKRWRLQLERELNECVRKDKPELVELFITETAIGMPITDIFGSIAVPEEERKKPQYYQGLKIRGKHKTDWAAEAGGEAQESGPVPWRERTTGPFLGAVKNQGPKFVDFWHGDRCVELYEIFGQKNKNVKSVQRITKEFGSWKKAVLTWIGLRKHLAVHVAVLRLGRTPLDEQKDDSDNIVKPMLDLFPGSLDKKSTNGSTPLWLAFKNHQVESAKVLIEAGADQTTRNRFNQNILHALLLTEPRSNTEKHPEREQKDLDRMEALIKLLDPTLLPDLFAGRSNSGPSGCTPLAEYLSSGRHIGVLRLLARYSPPEPYTMFDGAGQTPAHFLVTNQRATGTRRVLRELAALHPAILRQDNAMGQLPVELAWTFYLRHQTKDAPQTEYHWRYAHLHIGNLKEPAAERYKPREQAFRRENDYAITTYRTLRELTDELAKEDHGGQEAATGGSGVPKRHMISERDAREVARRLADRTGKNVDEEEEEQAEAGNGEQDEVTQWL
jgi:ankyrin repeat protein